MHDRLIELLRIAIKYDVSDIHFSVLDKDITIEMRVQQKIRKLKAKDSDLNLFYYLMYQANLDISEVHEPQTGSFDVYVGNRSVSCRFSLVSSHRITSGVLRILNHQHELSIEDLTYRQDHIAWLKEIGNYRDGLFLFCGPTGSGKTTSLYTILNQVEQKKIYTLEDPIEVYQDRFVQLQINEKQHLSYAEGIKQLMRHDPDIIMIGEIRDAEAAKMAVRTALTGHLVVTSLHSFSCVGAIERMIDLGVEDVQLQEVLKGITSQRLYEDVYDKKIGIYEIMKRKEIEHYFETKQIPDGFESLQTNIQRAIQDGIINPQQAKQDLLGF